MNMATDVDDFRTGIAIPHRKDEFNGVRDEYSSMLFHQMEAGNNGLTKTKFLTFGIHLDHEGCKAQDHSYRDRYPKQFQTSPVCREPLTEKAALMHQQFHMGDREKFSFDWKYLTGSGLSVKDFIAPSSFGFPNGEVYYGKSVRSHELLSIDASDISDRMLADFLNMESSQIVTMQREIG